MPPCAHDSANQLIRENNQQAGSTYTWVYDNAGNIQSKNQYAYTTGTVGTASDTVNYSYDESQWRDLLTAYDGVAITYDQIGNPLSDGTRSYTWKQGRQLATLSDGASTWTNTYNADGLRTSRTNGTSTYSYVYNGSQLVQMTVDGNTLYFTYDASGTPQTVTYNGTTYYYATNLQGDITAILDNTGTTVVSYTYDAWGNHTSTSNGTGTLASTLGRHNPLRYRSYVYDTETGLYYLQSRYYNPATGRFINADNIAYLGANNSLLSYNLFVYCNNSPINLSDLLGKNPYILIDQVIENIKNKILEIISAAIDIALNPPTMEEMAYAATIYTEAAGENTTTKRAIAHVIKNRVGTRKSWSNIINVISAPYQFSGYNNSMYRTAMHYYTTHTHNNEIEKNSMNMCLIIAVLVNRGVLNDLTQGTLYFHSLPNPEIWKYHFDYTQVYVEGTEKFWFYK